MPWFAQARPGGLATAAARRRERSRSDGCVFRKSEIRLLAPLERDEPVFLDTIGDRSRKELSINSERMARLNATSFGRVEERASKHAKLTLKEP